MKAWLTKRCPHYRKRAIWIASISAVVLILGYMIFMTPYFCAMLVRGIFVKAEQAPLSNEEQIAQAIVVYTDIEYPSEYGDNVLDIYLPKNMSGPFKTLIFTC